MNSIEWTEQDKLFGLDHSSKKGKFHDYEFDIRYDYDGDPIVKPENCGLCLTISKNKSIIASKFGHTIEALVKYSEHYLLKEKEMFL
jgi:hypothetical protein